MPTSMTNQEAFNIMVNHLRSMKERCSIEDVCRYRHDGRKCVIGALIPDDLYSPQIEGVSAFHLAQELKVPPSIRAFFSQFNKNLLMTMQKLHDSDPFFGGEFLRESRLEKIAKDFNLKLPE